MNQFITFILSLLIASTGAGYTKVVEASGDFNYYFSSPGVLYQTATSDKSTSPYWWLKSGYRFQILAGIGTVQGSLLPDDKMRLYYASTSPVTTDNGYHPQNVTKLLTKNTWENFTEQIDAKILAENLSNIKNRFAWNAISLVGTACHR